MNSSLCKCPSPFSILDGKKKSILSKKFWPNLPTILLMNQGGKRTQIALHLFFSSLCLNLRHFISLSIYPPCPHTPPTTTGPHVHIPSSLFNASMHEITYCILAQYSSIFQRADPTLYLNIQMLKLPVNAPEKDRYGSKYSDCDLCPAITFYAQFLLLIQLSSPLAISPPTAIILTLPHIVQE